MTGSMMPSSRMIRRTSSASLASRTKLSAMKSTLRCSAKRRSSMSFSDSAGTETATPGRLMPLWLLTLPPTSDLGVRRPGRRPRSTRRRTLPSSIRIGSPASTSPGRPSYVVPQTASSPGDVAGRDRPRLPALERDRAVGEVARAGSWGPGGRRRCRRRARSRRRPRAPGGRPRRGPRACRGSCSAGRRPCRRPRARGSGAGEETAGPRVQTILALRTTSDPSGS